MLIPYADKPQGTPGVKAGHGSMRPQNKKGDLLISRPTSACEPFLYLCGVVNLTSHRYGTQDAR